ncbi:MAG: hypothetical protein LUE24_05340 [Lachnospiraceae bacterium]|nr:hypothetical protein [Lachnospiraceae bacterium]
MEHKIPIEGIYIWLVHFVVRMKTREKKRMKRTWNVFVLTVLLLTLTACGKSTADQWQEQYDLGQKYLLEEDYEAAIVAFTAAIEIDPNEAAYVGRGDAYVVAALADSQMFVKNYEAASADYETALSLYAEEEDTSAVIEKLRESYLALAEYYEEQRDDEQALIYYEKAYQLTGDETIGEQIEVIKLNENQWKADLTEEETAVFENLIAAIDSGSNEAMNDAIAHSELLNIVQSKGVAVSSSLYMFDYGSTITGVGLCVEVHWISGSDGQSPWITAYYGEWKDGMVDGEGVLICDLLIANNTAYTEQFEKAVGSWAEGFAEGDFQYEQTFFGGTQEGLITVITGTLKSGYWDGEVMETYNGFGLDGEPQVTVTSSVFVEGVAQKLGDIETSWGTYPAYSIRDGELSSIGVGSYSSSDAEREKQQGVLFSSSREGGKAGYKLCSLSFYGENSSEAHLY